MVTYSPLFSRDVPPDDDTIIIVHDKLIIFMEYIQGIGKNSIDHGDNIYLLNTVIYQPNYIKRMSCLDFFEG